MIDAGTGVHLWADHFDGAPEDIFNLQDRVTTSVVGAVAPKLEQAEIERAKHKPTESLDAYDCYLRGLANRYQRTRPALNEALSLFYRAIDLDPQFAAAYGQASWCYVIRQVQGWMTDWDSDSAEATRLARKAVALGKDDAVALSVGSFALTYFVRDFDAGILFNDRAQQLNPHFALAWYLSGWLRIYFGEHDLAIKHFAQFQRMSPLEELRYSQVSVRFR